MNEDDETEFGGLPATAAQSTTAISGSVDGDAILLEDSAFQDDAGFLSQGATLARAHGITHSEWEAIAKRPRADIELFLLALSQERSPGASSSQSGSH